MRLLKSVFTETKGAGVSGGGGCSTVGGPDSGLESAGFGSLWPLGR